MRGRLIKNDIKDDQLIACIQDICMVTSLQAEESVMKINGTKDSSEKTSLPTLDRPALDRVVSRLHGHLGKHALKLPLRFCFDWRGIPFQAELVRHGSGLCLLTLSSNLGCLPYSTENADARQSVIDTVRSMRISGKDSFTIDSYNHVNYKGCTSFKSPQNMTELLTPVAIALMALEKPLQKLRELLHPPCGNL